MRQFIRILAVILTIAVLVGTIYFLVQYNKDYVENNPNPSGDEKISIENKNEKVEVTLESKENIERYAKEEKESLISAIKSTINLNTIANVRKTINKKISKSYFGKLVIPNENSSEAVSGENSGEMETFIIPDSVQCSIQVAGSMINIVPEDDRIDSIEFHYRGDNKLVAYVRKYAGTNIKATYYFENGELLDKEVNTFDTKYNVFETETEILKRVDNLYNDFLKED